VANGNRLSGSRHTLLKAVQPFIGIEQALGGGIDLDALLAHGFEQRGLLGAAVDELLFQVDDVLSLRDDLQAEEGAVLRSRTLTASL